MVNPSPGRACPGGYPADLFGRPDSPVRHAVTDAEPAEDLPGQLSLFATPAPTRPCPTPTPMFTRPASRTATA